MARNRVRPVPGACGASWHQRKWVNRVKMEVLTDADAVARRAAALVAAAARAAVAERGRFVMAVSGGRTPWQMLRALAEEDVPWYEVQIVQVDERVAPPGDADRNLTHLHANLLDRVPLPAAHIHAMPVEDDDLAAGARRYATTLCDLSGQPPVLDLVHLGLGDDGHTASLVPGDAALDVSDRDVAMSGSYRSHRRMTLTYPILNRARQLLWLVTGSDKRGPLQLLRAADASIPAARVCQLRAVVLADRAAAAEFA